MRTRTRVHASVLAALAGLTLSVAAQAVTITVQPGGYMMLPGTDYDLTGGTLTITYTGLVSGPYTYDINDAGGIADFIVSNVPSGSSVTHRS